jgi:hypothetical protein
VTRVRVHVFLCVCVCDGYEKIACVPACAFVRSGIIPVVVAAAVVVP